MEEKWVVIAAIIVLVIASTQSHLNEAQSATSRLGWPPRPTAKFVASTEKTFGQLMSEAMTAMDEGMHNGEYTEKPDHDFVTMMIPHHQGAIDMAKALLLYGKDPRLRRLAQEIITDQQSEIQLMQLWLKQHGAKSEKPIETPDLDASKH